MEQVSSGLVDEQDGIPAVQILAPLMQLHPDIEVEHVDDTSTLVRGALTGKWAWVFAGHTVYLVEPTSDNSVYGLRILHHKDIAPLIQTYLRAASCSQQD